MTSSSKSQRLAENVSEIFGAEYVIDASAGIGGNTLGFALNPKIRHVLSYESNRERWTMLNNNLGLYDVVNRVSAFNHSFEIGEDLTLLDVEDEKIAGKSVVYMDPPWLPPDAAIDKKNYILSGMKLSGKSLEYWCKFFVKQGFLGVILHVPPGYELILPNHFIDDVSDNKSRLIYYSGNESILATIAQRLKVVKSDVGKESEELSKESIDVPSYETGIEEIPTSTEVQGPKVILQTYLTPDFPRRKYLKEHFNPKAIHLGQRKLLLSEIEFLTRILRSSGSSGGESKEYTLLYVGAAPGQHIPILSEMFPEVKFVLYDPAPFKIRPTSRIEIHQELFTDELIPKYATAGKRENRLLFVSDIRSVPRAGYQETDAADIEFEEEVRKNLDWQRRWVEELRPVRSLLKFRLPFVDRNITDEKSSTEYFDGIINFQAYAPPQSAETRLEVGNKPVLVRYDHSRYEQQMFYFNTLYRTQNFQHYHRKYGWSYDTIREYFILKKYCAMRGEGDKAIPGYFAKFDELTDKQEKKVVRILEKY